MVNVLSTRQSDETHLNNFPKDFKLPTFFSPFQRKCANLLRRHWLLYWQNSRRIILQEIVVFQIKNDKNKNNKSCFPTKVLLWHQRWISFFFFFFLFPYFSFPKPFALQCHLKIFQLRCWLPSPQASLFLKNTSSPSSTLLTAIRIWQNDSISWGSQRQI